MDLTCSSYLSVAARKSDLFLTAARKYRLRSMASLVTSLAHASTMSKLQKEMYFSLSQL